MLACTAMVERVVAEPCVEALLGVILVKVPVEKAVVDVQAVAVLAEEAQDAVAERS